MLGLATAVSIREQFVCSLAENKQSFQAEEDEDANGNNKPQKKTPDEPLFFVDGLFSTLKLSQYTAER